jgi:hypothetical protein
MIFFGNNNQWICTTLSTQNSVLPTKATSQQEKSSIKAMHLGLFLTFNKRLKVGKKEYFISKKVDQGNY